MEGKGWAKGKGLGRHEQGITDAIKPKLKFDQAGMGHNKADEYEFHWWDHVFNKAAKSVKVEEGDDGQIKVDFNSSKSELSTKKLRKKAEKAMKAEVKNKLYSNFVKSGTLTGGKFEGEEEENNFVEDNDLSKIRTLTDEELIKACGGRTAHKGSRHGHKMNAKLARIEEAERQYMEQMNQSNLKLESNDAGTEVKKKKKKRKKDYDDELTEPIKKKKSKKQKYEQVEDVENLEPVITEVEVEPVITEVKAKKKKKKDKSKDIDEEIQAVINCDDTKRRKKKKKLKGGLD